MVDVIEACVSNVDAATRRALRDRPETTRVYPCLEQCGRCYREPFLVVDGDVVVGESHRAMLAAIPDG